MSPMNNPADFDSPPASPARRRRKWLLLGGLVLLPVLALIGGYVYLRYSGEWSWQGAVAEADRLDPGWRWEDLQARRRTYAENENGALVVLAARKLIPKGWPAWDMPLPAPQAIPDDPPEAYEEAQRKRTGQEEERQALQESFTDLEPQTQLSEQQLAALREELPKADKALAEARKLAKMPGGRFPIRYSADFISTLLPEVQEAREVATLLGYDVLLRAQEQDLAGALASCHALFNLCRSFDEEATLIAMLVRIACRTVALRRLERVLAQGEPEEADLARLQKVLQEEEAIPVLLCAYRSERAGTDMLMQFLETGQATMAQVRRLFGVGPGGQLEHLQLLIPGGMKHQRAALLRLNNKLVDAAKLPPNEYRAEALAIEKGVSTLPALAHLLAHAGAKIGDASVRSQAELRAAVAMLAAERYRRKHGRWPEDLAALTPDFLVQVPMDPYDGRPLRLRHMDDGLVIYSVGFDGTDDGGKMSRNPMDKGTDRGVRLWDVKHRRQPPRPPKPRHMEPPPD